MEEVEIRLNLSLYVMIGWLAVTSNGIRKN